VTAADCRKVTHASGYTTLEPLTRETVESMLKALWDAPVTVCQHCVSPAYRTWHLTGATERIDAWVPCAMMCGSILCLTKP